ncbi:MAG: EAL domain-containing protein [Proteobacteria bacterium]|nr:EAL domain-containing protein [Pseudomonadota bacterium]
MIQINDVSAAYRREKALELQVRDRKLVEQKLSQERALFISGPTVVLTWTMQPEWKVDYISPNILQQIGYKDSCFLDQEIYFPGLAHPDDIDHLLEIIEVNSGSNNSFFEQEFRLENSQGEYRWIYNFTTIHRDKNGQITKYLGYLLDITERKQFQEKIERHAFFDELTGLPNRRLFLDRLKRELVRARRRSYMGDLFFIDLDRFKQINDILGHDTGDLLLQHVAILLLGCLRQEDTAARIGGDEFVVILSDIGKELEPATQNALRVAEKIRNSLGEKHYLNGKEINSTPSIGIVTFSSQDNVSADDLLRFADTAMYRAKNDGRNQIRFFSPEMQNRVDEQVHLEKLLRKALEKKEFSLNFQPIFDDKNEIISAEALLRWEHPKKGNISPAEFIPVAEETGMILPLGEWVLREACKTLKNWETGGPENGGFFLPRIAINVSPKQFRQSSFVSQVKKTLEEFQLDPCRLEIELTEGVVIADVDDTIRKMHALKSLGISISIDDFGTGYSSLAYLIKLPIDVLKIDQSFVRDITCDKNNSVIVKTIISMAQHLKMNVIAEGVETEAQLKHLAIQGCRIFQGYLFSKPLVSEEFAEFYSEHKEYPKRSRSNF